ncbi:MAG TPA: response regulator, partial [Opitutaceae bacterium]|nr:response regulator [Opitutaceae bacterium]
PTQIHQVIMNLATNAAHAMRDRVGRLTAVLEQIEVDADMAALHPGLQPRVYMRLGISDTGHGMDVATLARIFDPFFTTKAPGEGTGLGLAVVHGIVQSHEGVITVYSQPGEGTQFHLYFPAHVSESLAEARPHPAVQPGRGERVLLIDDEWSLALLGKKILERLGYSVDEHTVANEAIAAFAADPKKYALVITDLTMPEMTGTSVAQRIMEISPHTPVLLTTGYSASLTREKIRELGIRDMLLKPFDINQLAATVRQVLEEGKH